MSDRFKLIADTLTITTIGGFGFQLGGYAAALIFG
jgi:hypothetical protein